MIRIYISGPMSGLPDLNKEAFASAESSLRAAGYEVLNPWLLDSFRPKEMTWAERVRDDIKLMMICNAVAVLPGWLNSRGARLETDVAHGLGWPIKPVEYYLEQKESMDNPILMCKNVDYILADTEQELCEIYDDELGEF